MKYRDYLKDNLVGIIIYLSTIILIVLILNAFKMPIFVSIICFCIFIICGISIITISYIKKNSFYKNYLSNLEKLSKKYLILETIPEPNTYEEKILVNSLYDINKSMIENINEYQRSTIEFKEFVELWIHEVKIPISSMVLKCHNNKEKYDKAFLSLIRRLDNQIDEVLYYVRSENTEKDFAIAEVSLKEVVRNVGLKNKDDLLESNIDFITDLKDLKINTDINNSIKYKKDKDSYIKISAFEQSEKKVLEIYDNGIGIPSRDLKRVFEKSFTGSNGREKVKSTGMGLYIVKKLCDKLGHNIKIESKEKEYTKVTLEFGKNEHYKIVR